MERVVKNPLANARDIKPINVGLIPGLGRFPGEGIATHSSILAWRIPWTEESGGPKHTESQRVGHDWATNTFTFQSWKNSQKPQFSSCKEASHWLGPILTQNDFILLWFNPQRLYFQTRSSQPTSDKKCCISCWTKETDSWNLPPSLPRPTCAKLLHSCPALSTLWTVGHQAPLSMGFSWQEYCSGLPCPPPRDLPDPGTELRSPKVRCFHSSTTGRPLPRPKFHCKPKEKIKWKKFILFCFLVCKKFNALSKRNVVWIC